MAPCDIFIFHHPDFQNLRKICTIVAILIPIIIILTFISAIAIINIIIVVIIKYSFVQSLPRDRDCCNLLNGITLGNCPQPSLNIIVIDGVIIMETSCS